MRKEPVVSGGSNAQPNELMLGSTTAHTRNSELPSRFRSRKNPSSSLERSIQVSLKPLTVLVASSALRFEGAAPVCVAVLRIEPLETFDSGRVAGGAHW